MAAVTPNTKTRILDAAEHLFASQGFAATSLRNVTAEAGANLAAVNYHFGSKQGLIKAVFARRFDPIGEDRLARLDVLQRDSGPGGPSVEEILEAFVRPVAAFAAEQRRGGRNALGALFGRLHTEPSEEIREILVDQFEVIALRFGAALSVALPSISEQELICRFHFLVSAMAGSLAEMAQLSLISRGLVDPERDRDVIMERLLRFLAGAMRAPTDGADDAGASSSDAPTERDSGVPGPAGGKP